MFGGVGRGRVRELFAGNFPMLILKKKQFFKGKSRRPLRSAHDPKQSAYVTNKKNLNMQNVYAA